MKTITTIQELKAVDYRLEQLRKISKSIHHIDECACNVELTHRQNVRLLHLQEKAQDIANTLGLIAYHQGDPRGCAIYLVEAQDAQDHTYTNGIAIC